MIEIVEHGNILKDGSDALVNPVNTVGVMGKGLALQFKKAYPNNYAAYRTACRQGMVQPGCVHTFYTRNLGNPMWIVNFPTKRHWRDQALVSDIVSGLEDLVDFVDRQDVHSIAIPALGCGLGGLKWDDVKTMIVDAFTGKDVRVRVYAPKAESRP